MILYCTLRIVPVDSYIVRKWQHKAPRASNLYKKKKKKKELSDSFFCVKIMFWVCSVLGFRVDN